MSKEIKKGKLNYDQSGRAYPDNPRIKENWDCIWENNGKYYKLVGDDEHKEWEEVNIYNHIINGTYKNYMKWAEEHSKTHLYAPYTQEQFINKCKTDKEFSKKWGLKIEERELSHEEKRNIYNSDPMSYGGTASQLPPNSKKTKFDPHHAEKDWDDNCASKKVPTKLITITYNDKTIESYE
jgi:hypothetical protein